jgi:hypothetical protein
VPRQLFLGVGERPILYTPPSLLESHRSRSLGTMKWSATDEDAGFDERLVVRPPGTKVDIVVIGSPCRKSFRRFED